MKVIDLTEKLRAEASNCLTRHETMRLEERSPDFFEEVKPHVDYWHNKLDEWKQVTTVFIQTYRPKHIRVEQVDAAIEGFKQYIVQSFYKETGKKRFVLTIQASIYTFDTLIRAARDEGMDVVSKENGS